MPPCLIVLDLLVKDEDVESMKRKREKGSK